MDQTRYWTLSSDSGKAGISFGFVHPARIEAEHQFPPYDSLYFSPGTSEAIVQWQYTVSGENTFPLDPVMDLSGSYLKYKTNRLFTFEKYFFKAWLLPFCISIAEKESNLPNK